MYLSKVRLDMTKRETNRCFYDRGRFHSFIENSFSGGRQHALWRVDQDQKGFHILVLSHDLPDFTDLIYEIGEGNAQTVDYDPFIESISREGTQLRFLIAVNPVICKNGDRIPLNVKRTANRNYCAEDWLKDRLNVNGASMLKANAVDSRTVNIKEGKGKFFQVTYQGNLLVTDQGNFSEMIRNGLGHAKAYGCGLLSVMPC